MLGMYFTISTYICMDALRLNLNDPVAIYRYNEQHRWLLRAGIAFWGIAAPCTILVAAVIRYVMWPAVIRRGGPHSLNSWRNIWMHNSNVLFALMERCLFSGMPIRFSEWALAPLYGCLYVLFSWNMTHAWNERRHGPQFIYYFLDTTLPGYYCSIALLSLLAVMTTFYAIYATTDSILSFLEYLLHYMNHAITGVSDSNEYLDFFAHLLVTVFLSSLVMRFSD
jgi:hypothetical protein